MGVTPPLSLRRQAFRYIFFVPQKDAASILNAATFDIYSLHYYIYVSFTLHF